MPSDRKPSLILPVAVALALLLAGYVLSVGPVERYTNLPARPLYTPLIWLSERSETVKRILVAYERWWLNR